MIGSDEAKKKSLLHTWLVKVRRLLVHDVHL